jgi:hypothetical protein
VLRTMFNRGQALPLDSTRILRPRISRGGDAEYPRGSMFHSQTTGVSTTTVRSRTVHGHDLSVCANSPQTVHKHSICANSPRTQARSQPGRIREHVHPSNSPRTGISRGHKLSATFPTTVHILELSTSSISARFQTRSDPTLASERTCWRVLVSAARAMKFSMPACIIPAHVRL